MSSSWPGITCCCKNNFASWVCCVKKTYDQVCLTGHQEEACGPISYTSETLSNQVVTCKQTCSATELECMCQCYNDNPECYPSTMVCFKRNYTDQITGQQADPCDPSSWLPPCSGGYGGGGGQGGTEGLDCSSGIGTYMEVPCTQWHVSGQVTYNPSEPCVNLCASSSTGYGGSGAGGGFGCSTGGVFGGGDSSQGVSDEYTSCEAVWTDEPCVPGPYTAYVLEGFVRPDQWVPPEDYECDDGCEPKPPRCIKWGCSSCGPMQVGCGPEPEVPDPDDPVDPDDPPEDPCTPPAACAEAACCLPPPPEFCCCTNYVQGPECLCLAGYEQHWCSETSRELCEIADQGSDNPPQAGDTQCWAVSSCDECLNEPPGHNPCIGVLTYSACSASCCPCGIDNCQQSICYPTMPGCDWPCCFNYPNNPLCCTGYPPEGNCCPQNSTNIRRTCGCACQDQCAPQTPLCGAGIWIRRRGACCGPCSTTTDASTDTAFNPNYVSPEAEQARLSLLKHLELFGYGTSYITSIQL
jgi:hypothetical protein